MKLSNSLFLFFFCMTAILAGKDSRIVTHSFINGHPVKLIFDTGAEYPALFQKTVDRLKLKVTEPPKDVKIVPGKIKLRLTEECGFKLVKDFNEVAQKFAVIDLPLGLESGYDGLVSWAGVKHNMVELDFYSSYIEIHEKLDFDKSEWKSLDIRTDTNFLIIKLSNKDSTMDSVLFDTGDPSGLSVRREAWGKLHDDSSNRNVTLSAMYRPGIGLKVNREKWVRKIDTGGMLFNNVPVAEGMESNPDLMEIGIDVIAGIWALSCYNWIIDGTAGKIYFKANNLTRLPQHYEYNRLGAVFVPKDIWTSNALVGHVIKGGPGYNAGIRAGDELLGIGMLDVTKWRTDPGVLPLGRFWERPPGTRLDLHLKRDGKEINLAVTLEEIFVLED